HPRAAGRLELRERFLRAGLIVLVIDRDLRPGAPELDVYACSKARAAARHERDTAFEGEWIGGGLGHGFLVARNRVAREIKTVCVWKRTIYGAPAKGLTACRRTCRRGRGGCSRRRRKATDPSCAKSAAMRRRPRHRRFRARSSCDDQADPGVR